jgi:hypothetical protein
MEEQRAQMVARKLFKGSYAFAAEGKYPEVEQGAAPPC